VVAGPALAADYYAGKTIQFVIGADVAGGYDTYGRLVAKHIGKHIPGNPTVVPQNMPGAGSAKAAGYMYSVAAKDGLTIAALYPGAVMGPLTDAKMAAIFDPTKFPYIGSADSGSRLCLTRDDSPVKKFEDVLSMKTVVGASQDGGSTKDFPVVMNSLLGAKFDIVSGYKGSNEILLAVERKEVDGICGYDWSSLQASKPDWVPQKKVRLLVQFGPEADPELTKMGVPEIYKFLKNDDDKKIFQLLVSQQLFGRPYILAPGTNPEAVKILRAAFDATVKDPDYIKEGTTARLSLNAASGEKVENLVSSLYKTPKALVDRFQKVTEAK
jgi:tripartite-type tricarboxylate transporter receptor subunit TctC